MRHESDNLRRRWSWRSPSLLGSLIVLLSTPVASYCCQPESHFLFRGEARIALDSLRDTTSSAGIFKRIILMHNLGFHKDKTMRERAETLLKEHFPPRERTPLVKAYAGSLQMIKVSHRTAGSKILRVANPFMKSPHDEAREGFKLITEAARDDPNNPVIRALRATAAAESADHLSEMFEVAVRELTWLESKASERDSVSQFIVNLNWAKYHYKTARTMNDVESIQKAVERIHRAESYACTPVYAGWAAEWKKRIVDLRGE